MAKERNNCEILIVNKVFFVFLHGITDKCIKNKQQTIKNA